MLQWLKKRTASFWIIAMYAVSKVYEILLAPIVNINIERWAESRGIDNELVDGGKDTMPLIDNITGWALYWMDAALAFLGSSWFFGFTVGAAIFGLWNPVARLLRRKPIEKNYLLLMIKPAGNTQACV